jgi:hypothetical protein
MEVILEQPLNTALKLVAAVHKSNKPDGIEVKAVQFRNTFVKLVADVAELNNPAGIAVKGVVANA